MSSNHRIYHITQMTRYWLKVYDRMIQAIDLHSQGYHDRANRLLFTFATEDVMIVQDALIADGMIILHKAYSSGRMQPLSYTLTEKGKQYIATR